MKSKRIIFLTIILCQVFLVCTITFSETIRLKTGKIIEGEILEKTDDYIKIDFLGLPITYYAKEIENIEVKSVESVKPRKYYLVGDMNVTEDGFYVSKEYGISVKAPQEWRKLPNGTIFYNENALDTVKVLLILRKYPSPEEVVKNPVIVIEFYDASQDGNFKSALELQSNDVNSKDFTGSKLIEAPKEIIINGQTGASMVYEFPTAVDTIKAIDCDFLLSVNRVCKLAFLANPEEFDKLLPEFQEFVNSLKLTAQE